MQNSLDRFLNAQEEAYPRALRELRSGRKESHWMWYIFPQLRGLGHSFTADYYGIGGRQEAEAYFAHPILGYRLLEISRTLLALEERDPRKIFGHTDSMKLRSSMTLFYAVSSEPVFRDVLDAFFDGTQDKFTLNMLKGGA